MRRGRRNAAAAAFIVMFLALSGCNDEAVRSGRVAIPLRIDGALSEWESVPVKIFPEKNVAIGALRDDRFLYVAARCADPDLNRQIGRRGITMWIDPDGGEHKDLELHFPASGYALPDPTRGGFWQAMSDSQRERAFRHLEGMRNGVLVIDRRNVDSRIFSPDSGDGFGAATAESNGILTFEVRIPLHPEQYFPEYSSLAEKEKIRVGFALVGIQGSGQASSGPDNLGPMGYPGGGRMGGGSRGMLQRRRTSTTESDLWVDILIAN